MKLLPKANSNIERTKEEKEKMIEEAAIHYGKFLNALGFDYLADENSHNTPRRVAKAWVHDIIKGCVDKEPEITAFPNDGYKGMVIQTYIPVKSLCSHHNLPIVGYAHVAYVPGENGTVIGLSKLNRIVDFVSRRPQLQEALTQGVLDLISEKCKDNLGVAVSVHAKHFCTCHRGVHHDSIMSTMSVSGVFFTNEKGSKNEFLEHIKLNQTLKH